MVTGSIKVKEPIIAVVGLGKMGRTLVHHIARTHNRLAIAVEKNIRIGAEVLEKAGLRYKIVENDEEVTRAYEKNEVALTDKLELIFSYSDVNIVVDCTGDVETGAYISYKCILNKINLVEINAELDATIGPFLTALSKSVNVLYTGDLGDEPGTIMHYLYRPLTEMGLDVLVAGKGKNNPLNPYVTPENLLEDSARNKVNPRVLTSFVDGTKTAIEMTILSNATGLLPDVTGMHGPTANLNELTKIFTLEKDGGILKNFYVVDYVIGIAPGVFTIATIDDEVIVDNLRYLKVGEGPNFVFYRPYHLPASETLLAINNIVKKHEPIIQSKGYYSETIAVAKRNLRTGERLDGIGGYTVYGVIEKRSIARQHGYLPIGLSSQAVLKKNVIKDEPITFDDVELQETILYDLWRLQQKI